MSSQNTIRVGQRGIHHIHAATENVRMGILGLKKLSRLVGIGKSFTPNFVPSKNNSLESLDFIVIA